MKASFEYHLKLHLIICWCEGEKQINMLAGNILSIICSLWNGKLREATLETHYGRNALFSSVQWVGKTPQNSQVKYLTKRYTSQSTGGCSQQDGSQDTWLVTAAGCLSEPRSISRATGENILSMRGAMGAGGWVLGVNIWSGVFHLTMCSRCGMRQGLHRRCEANKKRAAETKPDGPRRTFKIAGGGVGGQRPTCWTQATATTTTTTAAKKRFGCFYIWQGESRIGRASQMVRLDSQRLSPLRRKPWPIALRTEVRLRDGRTHLLVWETVSVWISHPAQPNGLSPYFSVI